jgi:hypothetical protein
MRWMVEGETIWEKTITQLKKALIYHHNCNTVVFGMPKKNKKRYKNVYNGENTHRVREREREREEEKNYYEN